MNPIAQQILKRLRRSGSIGDTPLPDEFVWPAYDGYSVANVAPTVLRHFGIGGVRSPGLAAEVVGGELEGAGKLVIMLADALGYLTLTKVMESGPVPGFSDAGGPREVRAAHVGFSIHHGGGAFVVSHGAASGRTWRRGLPDVPAGQGIRGEYDPVESGGG